MSNYYYGPALESELDYRRDALRRDAELYRLAREARRATRSARRPGGGHRTVVVHPAPAVPAQPAGSESPVARAA